MAVAEPSTNPRFAEDENIAFKTNENGVKVTWKSYEYDPSITTDQAATAKMTDDDLPNVIGVRWVYYDLRGFDPQLRTAAPPRQRSLCKM